MRIKFTTEGGIAHFPGLSKPAVIDVDQLPAEEGAELKRLVETVRFFDLPARVGTPARGAADYRQYTITVEQDGRRHTIVTSDLIEDSELRKLVQLLQAKAKAQRGRGDSPSPR